MLDAHSVDNVNKFLCDTCVMDFISKEDLDNHIASMFLCFSSFSSYSHQMVTFVSKFDPRAISYFHGD